MTDWLRPVPPDALAMAKMTLRGWKNLFVFLLLLAILWLIMGWAIYVALIDPIADLLSSDLVQGF